MTLHADEVPAHTGTVRTLLTEQCPQRAGLPPDRAGAGPPVWMRGDLRPSNLLVRAGRLHAVVDFGGPAVGFPDAEHAAVWDLPPAARVTYRNALTLDDATWQRARACAVAVGASGVA